MTYKVLNQVSILDMPEEEYCGNGIERHNEESDSILLSHGISDKEDIVIRRKDGEIECNCVYDAIQGMSIKEGVDIVEFENGKIGFVAYYGTYEDYFIIEAETPLEYLMSLCHGNTTFEEVYNFISENDLYDRVEISDELHNYGKFELWDICPLEPYMNRVVDEVYDMNFDNSNKLLEICLSGGYADDED